MKPLHLPSITPRSSDLLLLLPLPGLSFRDKLEKYEPLHHPYNVGFYCTREMHT